MTENIKRFPSPAQFQFTHTHTRARERARAHAHAHASQNEQPDKLQSSAGLYLSVMNNK